MYIGFRWYGLTLNTHVWLFVGNKAHVCVSGGKKCLFFGNFGVLCLLETPVLRFGLLPCYRRIPKRFQLMYWPTIIEFGITKKEMQCFWISKEFRGVLRNTCQTFKIKHFAKILRRCLRGFSARLWNRYKFKNVSIAGEH